VDLDVKAGEIVGFLGPNGAGKTTTLRMLTTLLAPTSGSATVAGCDLLRDPAGVRERIGYVPQGGTSNGEAKLREELVLQARLYRIAKAEAGRRADALIGELELDGLGDRRTRTLSGGQRRRLDIAMGLVHQPELVFLDEPSTGLDPQSRANLWQHIRDLRDQRGATVFLTTHYLEEADALCDRILVMDHGRVVAEGTPEELKRQVSGDVVTFEVADAARAAALLDGWDGVRDVGADGVALRLTVDEGDRALPGLLRRLDEGGVGVAAFRVARPSLDDVFLTLTGRSLRDEQPVEPKEPVHA
jgi:ABC-2 type transport system ATP-binding protein